VACRRAGDHRQTPCRHLPGPAPRCPRNGGRTQGPLLGCCCSPCPVWEESIARTGTIPCSGSIPRTRSVPYTLSIPCTRSVPRTGSVPRPRSSPVLLNSPDLLCPSVSGSSASQPRWQEGLSCTSWDAWGWSWAANKGQDLCGQAQTPPSAPRADVSARAGCRGSLRCPGRGRAPLGAALLSASAPKQVTRQKCPRLWGHGDAPRWGRCFCHHSTPGFSPAQGTGEGGAAALAHAPPAPTAPQTQHPQNAPWGSPRPLPTPGPAGRGCADPTAPGKQALALGTLSLPQPSAPAAGGVTGDGARARHPDFPAGLEGHSRRRGRLPTAPGEIPGASDAESARCSGVTSLLPYPTPRSPSPPATDPKHAGIRPPQLPAPFWARSWHHSPPAPSAQLLPRCRRADTSPAGAAGQTDTSPQPLLGRSRVTERRDALILRLFIGIALGSARVLQAGAWLTGRHWGGGLLCRDHRHSPGAPLRAPSAPRPLRKTPLKKKPQTTRNAEGGLRSQHRPVRALARAPGCKIGGGEHQHHLHPGGGLLGSVPGSPWGAVPGQAQTRGGINWSPGSWRRGCPLLPKAGGVQGGGVQHPEVLSSAELLTRGSLCHRLSPWPGGGWRGRAGVWHGAPSLAAPTGPRRGRQQLGGSQGTCQGPSPVRPLRHTEPSRPTSAKESVMQKALAKERSWASLPSPRKAARRSAPALPRKQSTRRGAEPEPGPSAPHGTAASLRPLRFLLLFSLLPLVSFFSISWGFPFFFSFFFSFFF